MTTAVADRQESGTGHDRQRSGRPSPLGQVASKYGLVGLLVAAITFFALWPRTSDTFASRANIDNLLADQTVVTVMALAIMLPFVAGCFDISAGATTAVSAVVTASVMDRFGLPVAVAVALALASGLLIGAVNGFAVARLGLNSIIFTLAMTTVLTGLLQWYTSGLSINARHSDLLIRIGSDKILGIPASTYVLVLSALVIWYLLEHTPYGRRLRATGVNGEAARLVGVDVSSTVMLSFILAGGLAAVAGIVLSARNGAANPGDGQGLLFPALAAVFLGTTAIRPGQFNVGGTVLGVFFVACCVSGLNLAGVKPWVQPVFNGAALAAAVTISTLGARHDAQRRH